MFLCEQLGGKQKPAVSGSLVAKETHTDSWAAPGLNLLWGKETKMENKQDNMTGKPAGEREKNKRKDKASASEEYLSFRSNQGFSISAYCSSCRGTRYFTQMGKRVGLLFQLLSQWCYESSSFGKPSISVLWSFIEKEAD